MVREKINWGMIGGGPGAFIGAVHRVAARITDDYRLVGGVFSSSYEKSLELGRCEEIDADRIYRDVGELVSREPARKAGDRIRAVTVTTPNSLHYDALKKLVAAGFHVICEKPITTSLAQAREIRDLVRKEGVVFCVTYTYTGYPMVRQMKSLIEEGAIGRLQRVDAQYYQGWINPFVHDPARRGEVWRLDPNLAGPSCCVADIGVHALNLIEYATGARVDRLLADLGGVDRDSGLDVDANVLLRMEDGTLGVIRASQVATGEENNLTIQAYGSKGGLLWSQENPNVLTLLKENLPASTYRTSNAYNAPLSLESCAMPPGHPEGLYEAFANLYREAARAIRGDQTGISDFPSIEAGVRGMEFVEAVVKSGAEGSRWVAVGHQ